MKQSHLVACLLATAALCACAGSRPPPISWVPRPGVDIAADRAECTRTAAAVDMNSAMEYTSSRYGQAAAMGKSLDRGFEGGTAGRLRDAVFEDCMTRKGWVRQ